ncbi:MAG TPA: flagellar assembly protein FliH [Spirochaetota bacterium]|nr:flagellar assembly protein FliH [Spirochaetota bacterium]HOL56318.1 flagellar assembly protein FliH [Spirochaetota bacterium]HPP03337.1 flagellar assembly protein FliH [Spirochaetota bacterium]
MAKNVFKSMEILPAPTKISIDTPDFNRKVKKESDEDILKILGGKSIEEIKAEKERLEKEIQELDEIIKKKTDQAQMEAEQILENARVESNRIIKRETDRAQILKQEALDEKERIIREAYEEANRIKQQAEEEAEKLKKEAIKRGMEQGYKDGYESEAKEVRRLVERIQIILNAAIEKRNEIFIETEQQIINLVLLIAKKVIKVISENQKNVVINNIVQALRKLKSRGEVAIRVNLADLELTTEHKKDFIEMVEGVKSIKILEDSTVDRGGCIIETDFGSIDARISSQLHEIEDRIVELMPIQSKGKQDMSNPV